MTPEELLAQLSQPGPGEAYLATQGAGSGMFNFGGPIGTLLAAQQLYKGYSGRKTAERQKEENLRLLALDAMAEQGIDPFAIYDIGKVESTIDPVEQAELDLARQEMDIITPPQPVAEGYAAEQEIKRFREENPDIIGEVYSDFLRSGLDYDEYRKQFPIETKQPSVTEEVVSVDVDADLTPQQTFEGLEEEQKIGRINDALEKNPNATLADILDILTTWNIPTDLFRKATGTTPEEYVGKGDAGTDGGDDGGDDGECQLGYEKWNGSCVPVCNAAAGYVRDEATGQCVLKDTREEGQGGGNGDTEPKENGQQCPVGQVYDEALQKCVPIERKRNEKDDEEPPVDLNEPVKQETILPQLPLTQEVTQEPESTTGMLFAALSPTRTTSEVLAPDLFKLDKNIPLVGRLTQSTPMAAPQYLLSGISQRYRV
jgi:hypothetical protein